MKNFIFHLSGDFCKLKGYYYCLSKPSKSILMFKGDMFPYEKEAEYGPVVWVFDQVA